MPRLDGAVVTVIALAMRLWTTAGELIAALASVPFERGLPPAQVTPPVGPVRANPDLGGKLS